MHEIMKNKSFKHLNFYQKLLILLFGSSLALCTTGILVALVNEFTEAEYLGVLAQFIIEIGLSLLYISLGFMLVFNKKI
jgi:ABC-type nickel/cobalt efflux system permease component RcnA